ncbi:MAG: hypothetical protein IPK85_07125 [Gemmatimonadetes bacterium]|nr:hypothetical protein [Gemmatimonadota bacterium]
MTLRRIVALASVLGIASVARAQGAPPFAARPLPTLGVTSFTYQSPSKGVTYDVSVWVQRLPDRSR